MSVPPADGDHRVAGVVAVERVPGGELDPARLRRRYLNAPSIYRVVDIQVQYTTIARLEGKRSLLERNNIARIGADLADKCEPWHGKMAAGRQTGQ